MEKAYKIALAKLSACKISTKNMCKKWAKVCKNERKCQKLQKNKKMRKKMRLKT